MHPSFVSNTSYQGLINGFWWLQYFTICLLHILDLMQAPEPWAPLHSMLDMIYIVNSIPLTQIKSHFLKTIVVLDGSSVESSP